MKSQLYVLRVHRIQFSVFVSEVCFYPRKQCSPCWDATLNCTCSGSALFANSSIKSFLIVVTSDSFYILCMQLGSRSDLTYDFFVVEGKFLKK